jgi:hypothetical protein
MMMKLIGFKRTLFLACLLILNIGALSAYFFSIGPMLDETRMQRDSVNAQIAELQGKIDNIKADLEYVKDNLPKYNDLKQNGFFLPQDRFMISRTMENLRIKAGISGYSFAVADVTEIPNADAAAIGHRLINSRIKVDKIVSPLDANIYILAQEMSHVFPDYARIQNMHIRRKNEVTQQALQDISQGKPVNFVDANLEFDWITIVPKPGEDPSAAAAAQAGFRGQ